MERAERYEPRPPEIDADGGLIHFPVQSVPTHNPARIARMAERILSRGLLKRFFSA